MPNDFTVKFGKAARTIEYIDALGQTELTFDIGSDLKTLILEHYPPSIERPQNYGNAFERAKQLLKECGYRVEVFGK